MVQYVREHGWIAGTPNEVIAALKSLEEVGVQRAMLGHYDPDDVDALRLIAEEVLPWT
jgi:alkanesulfonate monooxygenase SsuD/methylene tetrahydromethanopterin reductase-like flavin-dependent oxidoreductase (luciferase family)